MFGRNAKIIEERVMRPISTCRCRCRMRRASRLPDLLSRELGIAKCETHGLPPEKPGGDAQSVLRLEHGEDMLVLRLAHAARTTTSTGAHVWSCSRDLARWLFARRKHLVGRTVLEMGCGLAVPSLVAASCGAAVIATDETEPLIEHLKHNAARNACALSTQRLDFTKRADICGCGIENVDLVIFADCVCASAASIQH